MRVGLKVFEINHFHLVFRQRLHALDKNLFSADVRVAFTDHDAVEVFM